MSLGSSRNLIKYLEQQFSEDGTIDSISDSTLLNSINEYLSKHNTYDSNDNTKLSNELFSIYNTYIITDFQKESTFIEILTLLIPCIVETHDFMMWVEKYLQPTIDSAGLDTSFLKLCRKLVERVLIDIKESDDPKLSQNRKMHQVKVVKLLIESYLKKSDNDDLANSAHQTKIMSPNSPKTSPYELEERKRFNKMTIRELLNQYALKYTEDCLGIINDYISSSPTGSLQRLNLLSLLSSIIKSQPIRLYSIASTQLFDTLLDSLMTESSPNVINSLINITCMILPHICDQLQDKLPTLFAIYTRLVCWTAMPNNDTVSIKMHSSKEYHDTTPILEKEDPLAVANESQDSNTSFLYEDYLGNTVQYHRLAALLYGFYALNFVQFIKSPSTYLESYQLLDKLPCYDETMLREKSNENLQNYKFHGNFLSFDSAESELNDTDRFSKFGSPDDIAAYCLNLMQKPLSSTFIDRSSRSVSITTLHPPSSAPVVSSNLSRQRSQPLFKTLDFETKVGPGNDVQIQGIDPTSKSNATNENSNVDDLLHTHKLLFQKSNQSENVNDYVRRHSIQIETPCLKNDTSNELNSIFGSALEFYQRELLILSNELDFAEYVRDSTIYKFKKCKEEKSQLLLKLEESRGVLKENEFLKGMVDKMDKMMTSSNSFSTMLTVPDTLLNSNKSIKDQNFRLKNEISTLKEKIEDLEKQVFNYKSKLEPQNIEFNRISNLYKDSSKELADLSTKYKRLLRKVEEEQELSLKNKHSNTLHSVTALERQNFELTQDKQRLTSNFEQKLSSMSREYELTISELNKQVAAAKSANSKQSSSILKTQLANFTQKLNDYENLVNQLEQAIAEKELKIAQLGTTQPIDIPSNNKNNFKNMGVPKSLLGFTYESSNDLFGLTTDTGIKFPPMEGSEGPPTPLRTSNSYFPYHVETSSFRQGATHIDPKAGRMSGAGSEREDTGGGGPATTPGSAGAFNFSIRKHSEPVANTNNIVVKGRGGIQRKTKFKM